MDISRLAGPALAVLLIAAAPVAAQVAPAAAGPARPRAVVEGGVGWSGFADESVVHHTLLGLAARYYLTRRISVGPELQHMVGPGSDRDTLLTGNIVVDLLAPTATRPRRTTPYVIVGGGLFRHTSRFASRSFTATEGAATLGVGARGWVSRRVFVGGDARLGWEPHLRLAGVVGVDF